MVIIRTTMHQVNKLDEKLTVWSTLIKMNLFGSSSNCSLSFLQNSFEAQSSNARILTLSSSQAGPAQALWLEPAQARTSSIHSAHHPVWMFGLTLSNQS